MSRENVEIVRAAFEAFNRGDLEEAVKDAAASFELDFSRALGPYRGIYRLDQALSFLGDFNATFDSVRLEPDEFIDTDEYVVVPLTVYLQGRDGIETTAGGAQLWTIREGAVVRCCLYQDHREALEAAGLETPYGAT